MQKLALLALLAMASTLVGCGTAAKVPAATTEKVASTCASSDLSTPHLGDGTTSLNYYVIAEHLLRHPGSPEQTNEIQSAQAKAMGSSGDDVLKPPSASLVESEFSHLLGAIMRSNGALGAALEPVGLSMRIEWEPEPCVVGGSPTARFFARTGHR